MFQTRPPFVLLCLCQALICCGQSKAGFIFDAKTDFVPDSPVSGVNGVWSYGYLGGSRSFTLFEEYTTNTKGYGWLRQDDDHGAPGLYRFTGPSGLPGVYPDDLVLHPGSQLDDEYAVLRFTAPADGLYDLALEWRAGDSGAVDVRIFRNSVELFNDLGDSDGGSYDSSALLLNANETIDLRVGRYGSFSDDSTPIDMTITAVPEPAITSLLGCGLSGLLLRRQRRR